MLCDQIFRYVEPAESNATCKIPNFLLGDEVPLDKMKLVCTDAASIDHLTSAGFTVTTQTGTKDTTQ